MADLGTDTEVIPAGDGRYSVDLSPRWEVWGPQGGYMASVALRAAGLECDRERPGSITAHFHAVAAFAPVDVRARVVRAARTGSSVEVTIEQDGRSILRAIVWGVDEQEGLEHHTNMSLDVAPPESLPTSRERWAAISGDGNPPYEFWNRLDDRALDWIDDWDNTPPGEPVRENWNRFVDRETFDDHWVDACRALILNDLYAWPACGPAHRMSDTMQRFYAPTIELSTRFAGDARDEPWLYSKAEAPVAAGGVAIHRGEVWTRSGRLIALGGSTLMSRPLQRRPGSS